MPTSALPFKLLNYNDLLGDLRPGQGISLARCTGFAADVVDFRASTVSLHSHDSMLTYVDLANHQANRLDFLSDGYVDLIFLYDGITRLEVGSLTARAGQNDVMLILNSPRFSIVKPAASTKRGIHLKVRSDVLISEYGLRADLLADHVKAALLGHTQQPLTLKAGLSARSKVALIDIYQCGMQGVLFQKYLHAKTEELVCETVQALNLHHFPRRQEMLFGRGERNRQAIEAAAHILRRNIGHAPSNAEIARSLGMNRNDFYAGFKDLFGVSPAEYKRTQAFDWARQQLGEGHRSVKEIAHLTGYSGISSFSRSYSDHFGEAPSAAKSK